MTAEDYDFRIPRLGDPEVASPIHLSKRFDDFQANYVTDDQLVLYDVEGDTSQLESISSRGILEKAGPRELIFYRPESLHAAILTAGGLCPGLNDVIRAVVMTLWYRYGVRRISGLRYGYHGLIAASEVSGDDLWVVHLPYGF